MSRLHAVPLVVAALACSDRTASVPTSLRGEATAATQLAAGFPLVLGGTVITPDGPLQHGYVVITDGRITNVSSERPDIPDAVRVNTGGVILPGLVDLHNHVPWNVLPRWSPGRRFSDQSQWAGDPSFLPIASQFNHLVATHFCDMNAWGELRALVGGTTSIMATYPRSCIHGLVRNLDFNTGFYGTTELNREHVFNAPPPFPPPSDTAGRVALVQAARFFIANPFYEALAMHVAEGTDAYAEEQFTFLQSQRLLNVKGILIHGISLGPSDFRAMAAAGTALVWSPRSNLELYGTTADIAAALDAGVEVALAPDWALTGSSNMLDELKTAAEWNRAHLGGRLSDRQLVDMVTSVPARVAGVDDEVGAIRAGLHADVLVIGSEDEDADPYHTVVDDSPTNVRLVLVDGVPVYGDADLMQRLWAKSDLEYVPVAGARKALATPPAALRIADVEARLQAALEKEGRTLAPLTDMP